MFPRKSEKSRDVVAMSRKENNNSPCKVSSKVIFFATGNINKFNEARCIFSSHGFALAMLRVKGDEIQSDNLKEIARAAVANAFKLSKAPIFVEDAGLFINALNGFPGPYAAYAYKTLHNSGILKLMQNVEDRSAVFQSTVAYLDETLCEPLFFEGESRGEITTSEVIPKGKSVFGFDPVFRPTESAKTFAEMNIEEKNRFSHRASAMRKMADWYKNKKNSEV